MNKKRKTLPKKNLSKRLPLDKARAEFRQRQYISHRVMEMNYERNPGTDDYETCDQVILADMVSEGLIDVSQKNKVRN